MVEDFSDHGPVEDGSDDFHFCRAPGAGEEGCLEDLLDQPRPGTRRDAARRRSRRSEDLEDAPVERPRPGDLRRSRWKGARGSGTGAPCLAALSVVAAFPVTRRAREARVRFE